MAASTTQRPAALPPQFNPKPAAVRPPDGAVAMARTYLDDKGIPQKSLTPVPVDADERRTAHELHQCPHMRVLNGGGKERCGEKQWMLPDEKPRFCPQHGKALEKPTSGPSNVELVARDAVRLHGRSAAPWLIPAAGVAADIAMHLGGVGAPGVGATAPLLAAGAYLGTKRTLTRRAIARRRIEKGQRDGKRVAAVLRRAQRNAAVAGEVGLWGAALAGTDITGTAGVIVAAAGMVRWAIGAREWWATAEERRTRGRVDVQLPDVPVVEAPDPVRLRAVTTWAALIGCPNGPLAGTELVDFKRLPACDVRASARTQLPNWSAKVTATIPGSINMRESRPALLGRIAAAYGCTYADVSFTADESDLSVGWLRVQPDNLLAETRLWPGPDVANDWKRGRSRIGRFDDGQDIVYQWWTKTGAAHDLIGGCSGSGKSELIAQLILASLHSDGLVIDWVADPQGGQSYGALKDAVDWFARDVTEIKLMLLAALKEMYRRNDELAAQNIKTWQPTKAMPLLVLTLDEVQAYIDDPIILELVEKLVGQGRKCGIKMRLATQIIAAYNLGGSTYIKEQLKSGQTLIFRSMTDVAGRSSVEGDCPVDPTMLPMVWGANTCAAGETTAGLMFIQGLNGRDVYGRADFTGDRMDSWLAGATPGVFGAEAQLESGVLWGDRRERAKRLLMAGRSDVDLLSGGKAVELLEAAAVVAVSKEPLRTPEPGQAPLPDRARDVVLAAAKATAGSNGLVERSAIVAAVKGKVADGTRDKALTDLVAAGDLRRVKNGLYEVPGLAKSRQLELDAQGRR